MKNLQIKFFIQLFAIGTLASAGELHFLVYPVVCAILGVAYFIRWKKIKLSDRLLFVSYLLMFPIAYLAYRFLHLHPIVLAAHFSLLVHALSFLQGSSFRLDQFRLAFSFVHLLLAGALTPELHVGVGIFVTLMLILCNRILQSLQTKKVFHLSSSRWIRSIYMTTVLGVVFSLSLLIFAVLPRPRGFGIPLGARFGESSSRAGFGGQVSLEGFENLNQGDETIAYRIFPSTKNLTLESFFPLGLLKVRTLDLFDGRTWMAKRGSDLIVAEDKFAFQETQPFLELMREVSGHNSIGVPQGAVIFSDESRKSSEIRRDPSRDDYEWLNSRGRRLKYRLQRVESETFAYGPTLLHSKLPPFLKLNTRWEELLGSLSLAPVPKKNKDKVDRLMKYFQESSYRYAVGGFSAQLKGMELLESFMFEKKAGHCELFASSLAIALRKWGVPARLVSGYRLRATDELLWIATENSAHVWVEFWDGANWQWIDPTPPSFATPLNTMANFSQKWKNLSLLVGSYWYKYIVDFDPSKAQHTGWGHSMLSAFFKSSKIQQTQEIKVGKYKFKVSPFFLSLSGLCLCLLLLLVCVRLFKHKRTNTENIKVWKERNLLSHAKFLQGVLRSYKVGNLLALRQKVKLNSQISRTHRDSLTMAYIDLYEKIRFQESILANTNADFDKLSRLQRSLRDPNKLEAQEQKKPRIAL